MAFHLNYIGSKRTLFPILDTIFAKYITPSSIVADFFAGTGSVASLLHKTYGCKVVSNDVQYYAFVINKANLAKYSSAEKQLIAKK